MEEITVHGENIEVFVDRVIEKAKEGYVRVDSMELSMAVQTNYWVMTMVRPVESESEAPQEPKKNAGRPAKTKD